MHRAYSLTFDQDLQKDVLAAMKNASKAHSEWDRAKRSWNGTLAKSRQNARTKDTEMHKELGQIVKDGSTVDDRLVEIETNYKSDQGLDVAEIAECRELCNRLVTFKKEENTRANMLLAWIRME